jgi:hypothetical protein
MQIENLNSKQNIELPNIEKYIAMRLVFVFLFEKLFIFNMHA